MIKIDQNHRDSISAQLSKIDVMDVAINRELVISDIDRLESMHLESGNKYNMKNMNALIKYLKTILNKLEKDDNGNDIYSTCWSVNEIIPTQYPIQLINERTYNIDFCNYIELPADSKLVEVDLTKLCNIIAFEMMYRDLEYAPSEYCDNKYIESKLDRCSILGVEDESIIDNVIESCGKDIYKFSKSMVIENTPYMDYDEMCVYDYFRKKKFKTQKYNTPVRFSCEYASHIVAESIIKNSLSSGFDIKPLIIRADTIAFIISTDDAEVINNIIENINIRTFGRHFVVQPDVRIF